MKIKLMMTSVLLLIGTDSLACENHGGFGFGAFAQFHPLAEQHFVEPEPTGIEIGYSSKISVVTDTKAQLQFNYVIPIDYSDVELTLTASDNLILSHSSPLRPAKKTGKVDLAFTASHSGEHFILVKIEATQNNKPYSKIQRINITSS